MPLYIGRRVTGSGKSFNGKLDDIRIYSRALSTAEVCAMYDSYTHGKIYQNFEANNGTGAEYGWPINTQYGISAALATDIKHSGSYSWKTTINAGTPMWYGGSAVKSKADQWHLNLEVNRHDRLTFWIYASPTSAKPQAVRVKFFDHSKYVWDPGVNKDGFVAQTDQQVIAGAWKQMTVYLSQLPADFNTRDLDKLEFYFADPGKYYIDDIEITSADRVFQSFEKRAGVTTADPAEYGWVWNGTQLLTTTQPAEGAQSWKINATNTVSESFAGTGIKYQGKDFSNNLTASDIWNMSLFHPKTHPGLFKKMSFFLKQEAQNRLANNVEAGLFDLNSYTYGCKTWSARRSDYGQWTKINVPLDDFPADFNYQAFNKIEMAMYWPGAYYFDSLRFSKYPPIRIDEQLLASGMVKWPQYPGAVNYELQNAASSSGTWSTVYTGTETTYLTNSLSSSWYRVRWMTDSNSTRGTLPYISDWSEPVNYIPANVLIEKDKLQQGYVEWTFIPQTGDYEIQEAGTSSGTWKTIYSGKYKVPPPLSAISGKWYRACAVIKNSSGTVTSRGQWSPALLYDPQAFVTADGTALVQKKGTKQFLKITGVNLGNYLLLEPWMLFGRNHSFVTDKVYPDDYSIRKTMRERSDITDEGLKEVLQNYRRSYIKEADFDLILRLGVNMIRLPIYAEDIRSVDDAGNWVGEAFDFSTIDRIVKLAGNRGLYVLLDLHGAYGCQGKSDITGRADFNRLFDPSYPAFCQRNVELWRAMAEHYKNNTTVFGYDIINEPYGVLTPGFYATADEAYGALWSLYDRIYKAIRNTVESGGAGDTSHLIVMESVPCERDWDTLPNPSVFGWSNILYQLHYYGFTFDENGQISGIKSYDEHISYLNDKIANSKQSSYNVPVMIGEFNGFGEARIWELLLDTFNFKGWSWCSWSYKDRDSDEWGLYNNSLADQSVPDFKNDSLELLLQKVSKYETLRYHKPNNSLINILKGRAQLPGYIHDLAGKAARRSAILTWNAPFSASPVTKYVIRYGKVSSGNFSSVYTDNSTPGATIGGLSAGVKYQFHVEAVSANGTGPVSNTVTVTPSS
jgi:aryl-phospho-beta-D-glucosidase BglC (GH1 family)